jgi:hypothetical protein
VVTHTGEVLNTTATDQHDGVLLQVMADTGNVRGDLDTIREADTGDLTQSRVRLLGGHGTDCSADTALLGAVQIRILFLLRVVSLQQCGSSALRSQDLTAFAYKLVKSRHWFSPFLMMNIGCFPTFLPHYPCVGRATVI